MTLLYDDLVFKSTTNRTVNQGAALHIRYLGVIRIATAARQRRRRVLLSEAGPRTRARARATTPLEITGQWSFSVRSRSWVWGT